MTIVLPCVVTFSCSLLSRWPALRASWRMVCTASVTSCGWVAYASPREEVQERFLSMFSRTEGNCARAFTLGSQSCLSTSLAKFSPLSSECRCIQRSASTISVGYVEAARICATRASGYKAIGATSCCNSLGDGLAGEAGDCSSDWPVGPKDSACAVNCTSKQQRSRIKTCLDNFMTYSPVQNWDHPLGVKPVLNRLHAPSSTALRNLTGRAACPAGCHCGGPSLPVRRAPFLFRSHAAEGFQCRLRE